MVAEVLPIRSIRMNASDFQEIQGDAWGVPSNRHSSRWRDKPILQSLACGEDIHVIIPKIL